MGTDACSQHWRTGLVHVIEGQACSGKHRRGGVHVGRFDLGLVDLDSNVVFEAGEESFSTGITRNKISSANLDKTSQSRPTTCLASVGVVEPGRTVTTSAIPKSSGGAEVPLTRKMPKGQAMVNWTPLSSSAAMTADRSPPSS